MSRASEIVVVCEDKAHEVFVHRFLRAGWKTKKRIRVVPYPSGQGSGKAHVLASIGKEAKALASRAARTVLIVVVDADNQTVGAVHAQLDKAMQGRKPGQAIACIVPKWSIDTWLAYLDGDPAVNEQDKSSYKNKYRSIAVTKDVHPLVDALARSCHDNLALQSPPHSLRTACTEFNNIRGYL
jgi:hypothetical protein